MNINQKTKTPIAKFYVENYDQHGLCLPGLKPISRNIDWELANLGQISQLKANQGQPPRAKYVKVLCDPGRGSLEVVRETTMLWD